MLHNSFKEKDSFKKPRYKGIGIPFKIELVGNIYHLTFLKSFLFSFIVIMKVTSQVAEHLIPFNYVSVYSRDSEGDHFCKCTHEIGAANIH